MNIESLESKRAEIRASMSPDMSMSAFKVAQAKADLIALAISRIQAAEIAQQQADDAVAEVIRHVG